MHVHCSLLVSLSYVIRCDSRLNRISACELTGLLIVGVRSYVKDIWCDMRFRFNRLNPCRMLIVGDNSYGIVIWCDMRLSNADIWFVLFTLNVIIQLRAKYVNVCNIKSDLMRLIYDAKCLDRFSVQWDTVVSPWPNILNNTDCVRLRSLVHALQ